MDIEVTQSSQVTVVVPKGDLDAAAAAHMKQALKELIDTGKTSLVVDLDGVPYIDSAGLGELVSAMKRVRQAGGDLRLCALRAEVRGIGRCAPLSAVELSLRAMMENQRRADGVCRATPSCARTALSGI